MSREEYKLSDEVKKIILDNYKAFYDKCLSEGPPDFTIEELKSIGQKVFENILKKAFDNFDENDLSENDKKSISREIELTIRSEFPDTLWDTSLEWTKNGFNNK